MSDQTERRALKERARYPPLDMEDLELQPQPVVSEPSPSPLEETGGEILSLYRREDLEDTGTPDRAHEADEIDIDIDLDTKCGIDIDIGADERPSETCSPVTNDSGDEVGVVEALIEMRTCEPEQRNCNNNNNNNNSALALARAEVEQLRLELEKSRSEMGSLESYRAEAESLRTELHSVKRERSKLITALKKSNNDRKTLKERLVLSEEMRARNRIKKSSREPTERMMRKLFAEKVEELALTHARTTARMLNVQKRCFEEELETLEGEAHATVVAFERQLISLKEEYAAKEEDYNREKETTYAKTAAVMAAVRQKIEEGAVVVERLTKEKDMAVRAAKERHNALVEMLGQRKEAEKEFEKIVEDISRKNMVVERLQQQLEGAMSELAKTRRLMPAIC